MSEQQERYREILADYNREVMGACLMRLPNARTAHIVSIGDHYSLCGTISFHRGMVAVTDDRMAICKVCARAAHSAVAKERHT